MKAIFTVNLIYGILIGCLATIPPFFIKDFQPSNVWLAGIFWIGILILTRLDYWNAYGLPKITVKIEKLEVTDGTGNN